MSTGIEISVSKTGAEQSPPDADAPPTGTNSNEAFLVRVEQFEGPLDLLLKLIERKQLHISKISLAAVTEEFLHYVRAHPDMPPGPLAQFVWVASKLIWIKSQSLLPRPPLQRSNEEEEDPGDELVRRLEAYKRVQQVARWLRSREIEGLRSYERPVPVEELRTPRPKPSPEEMGLGLDGVTLARLARMVQRRMQLSLLAPAESNAVKGHIITVAEKIAELQKRLRKLPEKGRIPMVEEFVGAGMRSRTELVVLFLALLEIVRRKHGLAEQDELFGEIWLRRC